MNPKSHAPEQGDLLRPRLTDMRHELMKLAALIDWEFFEGEWAEFFPSHTGRPATSPRLVSGLLYLQHTYRLSDEVVVARWAENPYYQHFCGETFFQHRFPLDPSSLTRWRKRIGEEGVEWLLTKMIETGREAGAISERSVEAVIVDTTVMEKAISHPTDARLYEKARIRLVALAQEADLSLRQSYARLAPRLAGQVGRYAHAKQFKRMRKALRRLKCYGLLPRSDFKIHRDIPSPGIADCLGIGTVSFRRCTQPTTSRRNRQVFQTFPEHLKTQTQKWLSTRTSLVTMPFWPHNPLKWQCRSSRSL